MKQIYLFISALLLICSLSFGADKSASTPSSDSVSYSADIVTYLRNDTSITLSGTAIINYDGMVLFADSIKYHTDKRVIVALGEATLIDGADTLKGDYIAYNLNTQSGKVKHGIMSSDDDLHYKAERIANVKSGDVYVDQGEYSTCEKLDSSHYNFYSEEIKITPNDKAVTIPFILEVAEAPVIALPYFIIPLEKDRKSGWLTPRWGVGINGKGTVDNIGYYWAINEYVDFLAAGKIDDFETFLLKGESKYRVKDKLSGRIYADMALTDKFLQSSNRWSLDYSHEQKILPDGSMSLTGKGRLVSDNSYYKDFSEDTTSLLSKDISSNLALTKRFNRIGGYASLSWDRRQNLSKETVDQELPSFNFNLNQRQFFPRKDEELDENGDELPEKWYESFRWGYNFKGKQKSKESTDSDSIYKYRNSGATHALSVTAPMTILRYFTINPNFSLNQSFFDSYIDSVTDTAYIEVEIYDTMSVEDTLRTDLPSYDTVIVLADTTIVLYNKRDTAYIKTTHDTTYYSSDEYSKSLALNSWWKTGVNLTTKVYGLFPISIGRLKGIRHTLTPGLGYTFTPKKDLSVKFPTSIGISGPTGTKQMQTVNFSLTNVFHGKIEGKDASDSSKSESKKPTLLNLNGSGNYNFEADSLKMSNIALSASIPSSVVDLSYSSILHPYDNKNEYIFPKALSHSIRVNPRLPEISGTFWSGDFLSLEKVTFDGYKDGLSLKKPIWSFGLRPNYSYSLVRANIYESFKTNKTYNLSSSLKLNFSHRWSLRWGGTWSFTENTFINQSVSVYADLSCWDLKFDWYPTGVNSGRFYFTVAIKKHREIKWDKRS
jgi:lipopolysaccharide assembly outer membrane protein LptD (OstA)